MSDIELAWAAGFMDGEGTFGWQRQLGRKPIPYVQATQVDRRPLDRLHLVLGIGKVYGPYVPKRANEQPYFYFRATGVERTLSIAELLRPWLSPPKREQADQIVAEVLAASLEKQARR